MYTFAEPVVGIQVVDTNDPVMDQVFEVVEFLDLTGYSRYCKLDQDEIDEVLIEIAGTEQIHLDIIDYVLCDDFLKFDTAYHGSKDNVCWIEHTKLKNPVDCSDTDDYVITQNVAHKIVSVISELREYIANTAPADVYEAVNKHAGIVYSQRSS